MLSIRDPVLGLKLCADIKKIYLFHIHRQENIFKINGIQEPGVLNRQQKLINFSIFFNYS